MQFNQGLRELSELKLEPDLDKRAFPQLYRSDINFARSQNNASLNIILNEIESWVSVLPSVKSMKYVSIDTKIHMLKKGWNPSIPGWHLDDFWRPTGDQPAIAELPDHPSYHFFCLLGDASRTEYMTSPTELPVPSKRVKSVYGWYNRLFSKIPLVTFNLASERLYLFTQLDWHRGVEATKDGWRVLLRCTYSMTREPKNETRTQQNVYINPNLLGW